MALACGPDVLIADEPTTALDATVQRQILELIAGLVAERGMALVLISHDLGVVAQNVERVLVMYGGSVVEDGPTREVFAHRAHPYTHGLFAARPRWTEEAGSAAGGSRARLPTIPGTVPEIGALPPGCSVRGPLRVHGGGLRRRLAGACGGGAGAPCALHPAGGRGGGTDSRGGGGTAVSGQHAPGRAAAEADDLPAPLLEVRGLVRDYPLPRERLWTPAPRFRALDGVDFALAPGRSLGVVGESGSGKSTLARLVMALDTPTAGQVLLRGAICTRSARRACARHGATCRWCSRTRMVRWIRA